MTPSPRDVVIVGGGPAGATTAIALAKLAPALRARVVVLEKGVFPRDKYCAGAIGRRGDKILEGLDARPDVPAVPIDGIALRTREGEVSASPGRIGRVIRRIEFDHALAEIARRRGVEVQDGVRVESVRASGSGVEVVTSKGTIRAALVVGADGVGSVVRRAMGVGPGRLRAQVVEVDTGPAPGDPDRAMLRFDLTDRDLCGYAWDFPTAVDGASLWCRGVYALSLDGARADVHALLARRLQAIGLDLGACREKRYAERGFEPKARIADGRLMLVGEAAGIDPVTGEGIPQAIEFGAMAGRFLAAGASGDVGGWSEVVRRSRLRRDLSVRTRLVRSFYGASRPAMERFALSCPSAVHLGCQHFADRPFDRLKLAEVALRGTLLVAGLRARRIVSSSPSPSPRTP
jgi:flavin-dependent dehydrogenase